MVGPEFILFVFLNFHQWGSSLDLLIFSVFWMITIQICSKVGEPNLDVGVCLVKLQAFVLFLIP